MTAKRFIIKNERTVCDGFYGKCFVCSWKSDAEEMCGLLNELHEENQHKQKLLHLSANKIENLLEENEQLKKENRKLKEDLEHCANQFTNEGKNVLLSLR